MLKLRNSHAVQCERIIMTTQSTASVPSASDIAELRSPFIDGDYYISPIGTRIVGNYSRTYRVFPAIVRVRSIKAQKQGKSIFHDYNCSLDKGEDFSEKQYQHAIRLAKKFGLS